MRGLMALLLAGALTGCNDPPQARTEADIRRIAAEENLADVQRLQSQVDALRAKSEDLEKQIAGVRNLAILTSEGHESLVKTFNGNVDRNNAAAVRDMTRRGACGTEAVNYPNGGVVYRNKDCTLKDLR